MAVVTSTRTPESLGDYDLFEKVGEGGLCTVYRGRHRSSGEVVAVKVLSPEMAKNEMMLRRFEQEFRAASSVNHPGVVRALDFRGAPPVPYLVLEFVQGQALGERLVRSGRMGEDEAVGIIVQVCEALQYLHELGIIHRDIKPDNIIVTAEGKAKLTDLGLAKETETDLDLTRTGRGLGTPHFMAPEQFRDAKGVTTRSDIYALGATLYMMVTGKLPFGGTTPMNCWIKKTRNELRPPRSVVPALSPRADVAIRRAMAPRAEDRPESCLAFAQELTGGRRPAAEAATAQPLYLSYEGHDGQPYVLTLPAEKVREWLQSGPLNNAANLLVSRSKSGPFEPIDRFPDLAGLARQEASAPGDEPEDSPAVPASPPQARPPVWLWAAASALAALAAGLALFGR
jgi:eukaryotic-like serine/threonine-protein kinase